MRWRSVAPESAAATACRNHSRASSARKRKGRSERMPSLNSQKNGFSPTMSTSNSAYGEGSTSPTDRPSERRSTLTETLHEPNDHVAESLRASFGPARPADSLDAAVIVAGIFPRPKRTHAERNV